MNRQTCLRNMKYGRCFITGSSYTGSYNSATNSMVGYGRYSYPNGSSFTGYFERGLFCGVGIFELAAPYKIRFKAVYIDGRIIEIQKFSFGDGLRFHGEIKGRKVNTEDWTYLIKYNRLYPAELSSGLPGVGPNSLLTESPKPSVLPHRSYDVGEGVFKPLSRFVVSRKPPLSGRRFVCGNKAREWIYRNCRASNDIAPIIPDLEVCRNILDLNRDEMFRQKPEPYCPCRAEKPTESETDSTANVFTPSTTSIDSMTEVNVNINDILPKPKTIEQESLFTHKMESVFAEDFLMDNYQYQTTTTQTK